MKIFLLLGSLVAVLATGCQSTPTPGKITTTVPAAPTAAATQSSSMPSMAAMPGMAPAVAGASPRTQAMRLHDAAMHHMDALMAEPQRLASLLAHLPATTPASQHQATRLRRTIVELQQADAQMMAWMHQLREPDSTRQPQAQVANYWRQQLPTLRHLNQRITAALDSAHALR